MEPRRKVHHRSNGTPGCPRCSPGLARSLVGSFSSDPEASVGYRWRIPLQRKRDNINYYK